MVKQFKVRVLEKKNLAANYWWLKLEKPDGFEFKAGQYLSMKVNDEGLRRSYSIGCQPKLDHLELLIDTTPMGPGSQYVLKTQVSDQIEILGPMGQLVDSGKLVKKLFVATGCGVVPLRSMINDLLVNKGFSEEIKLHWGMRHLKDMFWKEEFEALAVKYPNFKFDLVLSQPEEGWMGCTGHIQDCLVSHEQYDQWEGYVCGNPGMVEEVREKLRELGLASVTHEKFG